MSEGAAIGWGLLIALFVLVWAVCRSDADNYWD